nr:PREDICTED: hemK methyltransferase family member 1 [Tribolium castaneum]|eukprot:XP_972117.1 PREDICTED: hemK methyltransferase family member 1 [Tribolium castaneum]
MLYLRKAIPHSPHFCTNFSNIFLQKIVRLKNTSVNKTGEFTSCQVGALFETWRQKFDQNSISEPRESIEYILAHCLGTPRISDVYKYRDMVLDEDRVKLVESLCLKRLQKLPVQYVLGECYFRQLVLKMSPPVFIPRPETEQLVDIVLGEIDRKNCRHFLELCCGSGAIALSLLQERPQIKGTALDQSKAACHLTKENAQKAGLNKRIRIIQSQLAQWHRCEKFDIIVSNPPYVFSKDLDKLQPEIKLYEDLQALDGGVDGLKVIKQILELSSECLNMNGKLFLEVEPRHPTLLQDYLTEFVPGLAYAATYKDLYAKDRFVEIIKTIQ